MSETTVRKANLPAAALAVLVAAILGISLLYAVWIGIRNFSRIGV